MDSQASYHILVDVTLQSEGSTKMDINEYEWSVFIYLI